MEASQSHGAEGRKHCSVFRIAGRKSKPAKVKCRVCILLISYILISTDKLSAREKRTEKLKLRSQSWDTRSSKRGEDYMETPRLSSLSHSTHEHIPRLSAFRSLQGDRFVDPSLLGNKTRGFIVCDASK